ncbi:MAG: GTPase Era [Rhodospirillaceae bacterium]|nr:GTPase Era [Rhodospirillaceae bacterium]MBL6931010.1 GTPase Era [Rhodospirillales bacterium]MBL6942318.1 GTPase Era [Rhodospirillales bacterium]
MSGAPKTRCGFFALIGAPNVGKSTLVNRLVGAKVSIVSPKVQTTRTRVLGIAIKDQAQIIFIDTPGIFAPKRRLDRAMVASAWGGVSDADGALLLVDALRGINADTQVILDGLKKQKRQVMLGINKIDLVKKPVLLDLAAKLSATGLFTEIFMISAETGDGVDDLMEYLSANVGESPWMFPEDQISDMPSRLLAAEVTREKVFLQLHQELPYAVTVETEKWEQRDDGSAKVDQIIFVERPGQKAIVLGKKGARIKKIGEASRRELEDLLGHRVHLFLFVKVREKWGDDPERYHDWGLDFNAK